jgi:hypothetical protein
LVDFTDFMPTLSDIINLPIPKNYGIMDGFSFYPVLFGGDSSSRDHVFLHYQPLTKEDSKRLTRYAGNANYKLYDNGKFYNVNSDVEEDTPLPKKSLTPQELQLRNYFQQILDTMHN